MVVQDIIRRAAMQSGVVPSFNPDEIPRDVMAVGLELLKTKIIPQLNCDRTIDITVTSRVYTSNEDGEIYVQSMDNSTELPIYSSDKLEYTADELIADTSLVTISSFLQNDIGNYLPYGIWSSDGYLLQVEPTEDGEIDTINYVYSDSHKVNTPFRPAYIQNVIDKTSRVKLSFCYLDEFESFNLRNCEYLYTTEDTQYGIKITLGGRKSTQVIIILPVPLTIIQSTSDIYGEIKAPAKFDGYITDYLALLYAIEYGISTKADMEVLCQKSYNLLKKNSKPRLTPMNVSQKIYRTIRRPGRRRGDDE